VKEDFPFIESGGPQKRLEHLKYLFKMAGGGGGVLELGKPHFCLLSGSLSNWAQEVEGRTGGRKGDLLLLILLPVPANVLTGGVSS